MKDAIPLEPCWQLTKGLSHSVRLLHRWSLLAQSETVCSKNFSGLAYTKYVQLTTFVKIGQFWKMYLFGEREKHINTISTPRK